MDQRIKNTFPFPSERPDYQPFSWKLDGGGREMILSILDEKNIQLMVEVGVLYGGSALQWLKHKNDLVVVGIDPWEFDQDQVRYWWSNRQAYGLHNLDQGNLSDNDFLQQLLRPEAAMQSTISNLWEYRDRFVPVRGRSPEMLYELHTLGLRPDLVYLDSDKELKDLWICNQLWPNALLTGDDWTWTPSGQPDLFPVQISVEKFASERRMQIRSRGATWCLVPSDDATAVASRDR